MTQYKTTLTDLSTNDDGRRTTPPRLLVVHSFEDDGSWPAERMADYQSGRLPHQRTGSYHVVIDREGRSCRENDNEFISWSAGWNGNRAGLHASLSGRAAFTREQWLARRPQLDELARWLAHESRNNSIPLAVVPVAGIRSNGRGVCSHADISRAWPRDTDHTDPGPNFPWDYVLQAARAFQAGTAGGPTAGTTKEDTMDPYKAHQLADINEQLTGSAKPGEFPGWPQLDDRTLVDAVAVIGQKLGVPGFYDPRRGE